MLSPFDFLALPSLMLLGLFPLVWLGLLIVMVWKWRKSVNKKRRAA